LIFSALPAPDCYPDALGGMWCFVLVKNDEAGALENVTGLIKLQQGEEIRQEIALTPLNLLPAGESLPLTAYFPPPVSEEYSISASVDFFLPVLPEDANSPSLKGVSIQHMYGSAPQPLIERGILSPSVGGRMSKLLKIATSFPLSFPYTVMEDPLTV